MLQRQLFGRWHGLRMRTVANADAAMRLAVTVVDSLLLVALAYALAQLLFALFAPAPLDNGEKLQPRTQPGSSSERQLWDVASISNWQLFGKLEPPHPVAAVAPTVPTTPLSLRLVGVFAAAPDSPWALALIAEGDKLERAYRIGAPLPGEARLQRIAPDHVVLLRHGREEILSLPRLNALQRSPLPNPTPSTLPAPSTASSAIVERLRSELVTRPDALQDLVVAAPYAENGQFLGFRLRPGRQRETFEQLGLQGGDVLIEVNGTRLTNPAQGMELAQLLLNANPVTVRILRNGAEVTLTFDSGAAASASEESNP